MNSNAGRIAKKLARRKRRIEKRLRVARDWRFVRMASGAPAVLSSAGLKYELAQKTQAIVYGGVPLMLRVARESGLIDAIDSSVPILKWRCPYYESDHVLNLAMNALCEGTCLEHIERRRNDEAFLNAIGADSIPDPTTAGDFCRRFNRGSVRQLLDAINVARLNVWKRQPQEFFDEAIVDMDDNVKRQVIRRREFEHLELKSEQVAEFEYRPTACQRAYRMVVIRKNISHEKGEKVLFDEIRYFFYITNDRAASAAEIVFGCDDRCDQENLIAQLAGGARAPSAPVDSLVSNWAYTVMTSLAWTLKAWSALLLPVTPRHRESHAAARTTWLRMEFKTFVNEVLKVPCQIVRQGRRIIHRVLHWNPQLPTFFRLATALNC